MAASIPPRTVTGLVRLPLDRAFTMKGFGTVVTGTLQGGTLQRGQALMLEPGGLDVRARGLQMHGRAVERVVAGSRVALNLTGVEVDDVHRGMTLVAPNSVTAVDTIDVELQLLPEAPELRHRARVQFHSFTSETIAAVSLYEYRALQPNAQGLMRLKLANPVVLLPGDRFVLRRPSPPQTLGGGRVLDAHPLPHTRKKKALRWLEEIQKASPEDQLLLRIQRRGNEGISLASLGTEMGLTHSAVEELANPLVTRGDLVSLPGGLYVSREAIAAGSELVLAALAASGHRDAFRGVKRSELRNHAGLGLEVFDALLDRLVRERKIRVKEESVALYSEGEELPDADRQRIAAICSAYESAGLQAALAGGCDSQRRCEPGRCAPAGDPAPSQQDTREARHGRPAYARECAGCVTQQGAGIARREAGCGAIQTDHGAFTKVRHTAARISRSRTHHAQDRRGSTGSLSAVEREPLDPSLHPSAEPPG